MSKRNNDNLLPKGKNPLYKSADCKLVKTKKMQKIIKRHPDYFLPRIDKAKEEFFENGSILTKFVDEVSSNLITESTYITSGRIIEDQNAIKTKQEEKKKEDTSIDLTKLDSNVFLTEGSTSKKEETSRILTTDNSSSFSPQYIKKKTFNFKRLRTYQPKVNENWKFKNGLCLQTSASSTIIPCLVNSIEFQGKTIEDQVKLLSDNIAFFKQSVIHENDFTEAFKFMPLKHKIKFNQSLEETIGILYLLPQLLLQEFYHFIVTCDGVARINVEKLRDKYITDEEACFIFNNALLSEINDFFKSCFDVYLTLCKEVDDMILKPKKFENVITILEKARYNISSVVMRANNAIKNYKGDIGLIDNVLKVQHKAPIFAPSKVSLSDKMRNQFVFKKNEERQRVIRINNLLKQKKVDDADFDYAHIGEPDVKDNFKSIIESGLVSKLLKYCEKDIQKQIVNERLRKEFEPNRKKVGEHKIVSLKI